MTTPCDWPLLFVKSGDDLDADPPVLNEFEELTEAQQTFVAAAVTQYLWNWSGRVYGVCEYLIRPCRVRPPELSTWKGRYGPIWKPVLLNGKMYNLHCGTCQSSRGCLCGDDVRTLVLPAPTQSILAVRIDGQVLPATAYRLDSKSLLTRTDGLPWPSWQDLSKTPGEAGTWEVEFEFGRPVPEGGQIAAGALAIEFAKALTGDRSCQLPTRVQSITRQGVAIGAMIDTMDDIDRGRTGLWVVDSWLASVTKPVYGGSVRSPDVPRRRIGRIT